MAFRKKYAAVLAAAVSSTLVFTACAPGSLGSSDPQGSGSVTLSWLVDNTEITVKTANALATAFTAKNPGITVKVESRPGGSEGDNLVKTRLSTGEMTDLFSYNSGSLFQALSPEQNLVPLTGEPWVANTSDVFQSVVKKGEDVYGAPIGGTFSGGILYNAEVYAKLGLEVPKTWSEFMANNAKIKSAGIDPVIQSYQDTWTSQLFVLGDYHNVAAADASWAEKYTGNQVKYVDPPAFKGFQRMEEVSKAGYLNKEFASTSYNDALKYLGAGKGAHYPMFNSSVASAAESDPTLADKLRFFPVPGDDAATNGATLWLPAGVYVPKSTEGAQLEATKKLLAFIASPESCAVQSESRIPEGPYAVTGCELPDDVPQAIKDLEPFLASDATNTPALEYLSPIKGPSLEQITVEVGSGLKSAADGAALYDKDVKKQAQQLGLPGWE